jgi:hypothetical protein
MMVAAIPFSSPGLRLALMLMVPRALSKLFEKPPAERNEP